MQRTDKYSQHSSIIWPVWLNGWVLVCELSGHGFEFRCSHLTFRYRVCFEQRVPWHSGNYRVWIHSKTRTWYDKNIQIKTSSSCQTLLKTLEISRNTPLASSGGLQSHDSWIFWVIDSSCKTQESPEMKLIDSL